jgi:conserved oligomeric Golgi complex subunit 1
MAAPDTSNLTSSSQVFTAYTLPQIRAIHKSLHVQIDEKAARLRTKVGNSYRELLGTADTIVQMRHDMDEVQTILGQMGSRCGRASVFGKAAGLANFQGGESTETELGRVARVKLLEACELVVNKLLRATSDGRGERMVLAAKILVLSRLLITSFRNLDLEAEELEGSVEGVKRPLLSLRRRLLRSVEKLLARTGAKTQIDDILKALCAYSLASSSGAKDVLRHFLMVRGGGDGTRV